MAVAQGRPRAATTNAKIAAPGAALGAAFLHRKIPPRGLPAAIDADWIVREPKLVTKRALKVIDHEVLWLALHLDTDNASAFVEAVRRRCEQLADDARTLRARATMLDRVVGPELDMAIAHLAGHHRGGELARKRWLKKSAYMLADMEDACDQLNAIATTAEINHGHYRGVAALMERRRSPKHSGQWRAVVLAWLLRVLGAGGKRWTHRDLAELIIVSQGDYTREHRPPCSAFADGASVCQLADRIKHSLARHK
jgi:hypothetical protein